jgi:hypothetical protein
MIIKPNGNGRLASAAAHRANASAGRRRKLSTRIVTS